MDRLQDEAAEQQVVCIKLEAQLTAAAQRLGEKHRLMSEVRVYRARHLDRRWPWLLAPPYTRMQPACRRVVVETNSLHPVVVCCVTCLLGHAVLCCAV